MTRLTTPFCPECGHVKHVAGCPETRAMTDLEALAKLAQEATPGPWVAGDADEQDTFLSTISWADAAYIAAASPDVVLALVKVALAAGRCLEWGDVGGLLTGDVAALRAALADLDR